jgi:hypothetical protein
VDLGVEAFDAVFARFLRNRLNQLMTTTFPLTARSTKSSACSAPSLAPALRRRRDLLVSDQVFSSPPRPAGASAAFAEVTRG